MDEMSKVQTAEGQTADAAEAAEAAESSTLPAVVAEVEGVDAIYAAQMAEMDRRLRELEAAMGDLRSATERALPVAAGAAGRKTLSAGAAEVLRKGEMAGAATDGAALDAALAGLPVEQRLAVKSHMLRSGLLR